MKKTYSPTYTALDLLETVIEFTNMTSDEADWSFEKQKYNDPRMVRLMQIWSLMGAFTPELLDEREIGESIRDFYSGEYILERHPQKDYASLQDEIYSSLAKSPVGGGKTCPLGEDELRYNYQNLLDYYRKLKKLLGHNSGIMEISYPYYFSYLLTRSVSDSIGSHVAILRGLLVRFIDPRGLSFTREEMIERFFYPEDDLGEVDLDWM